MMTTSPTDAAAMADEVVTSDAVDLTSTDERTIVDLRGLGPFRSVGHYRYLAAHHDIAPQRHRRLLVLSLPLRGRFDFMVDGRVVSAGPGQVICVPPGSVYSAGIGSQPRGELLWVTIAVDPAPDGATTDSAACWSRPDPDAEDRSARVFLTRTVRELADTDVRVWSTPALSVDLLLRVVTTSGRREPLEDAWRYHLCSSALIELLMSKRSQCRDDAIMHPGIRRAVEWLQHRLFEAVTVSDLLEVSQLSATHFYQLFVQTVGTTPKDYLLRVKIDAATELLARTEFSVTDVAHQLGFSSGQHFAAVFRRYVGRAPSDYRADLERS